MARKRPSGTKRMREQARRRKQEDKAQRKADRLAAKDAPPVDPEAEGEAGDSSPGEVTEDDSHLDRPPRVDLSDSPAQPPATGENGESGDKPTSEPEGDGERSEKAVEDRSHA